MWFTYDYLSLSFVFWRLLLSKILNTRFIGVWTEIPPKDICELSKIKYVINMIWKCNFFRCFYWIVASLTLWECKAAREVILITSCIVCPISLLVRLRKRNKDNLRRTLYLNKFTREPAQLGASPALLLLSLSTYSRAPKWQCHCYYRRHYSVLPFSSLVFSSSTRVLLWYINFEKKHTLLQHLSLALQVPLCLF